MQTLTQQILSLDEAKARFAGLVDLRAPRAELPPGAVPGVEIILPSPNEDDERPLATLFVWVPEMSLGDLRALTSGSLWQINLETLNLLRSESFMVLGPEDGGIYIPMWGSEAHLLHQGVQTIRMVFIADEGVLDVRHHFTGEDLMDFVGGGQGQMDSTGPNYNCGRRHSEEELCMAACLGYEFSIQGLRVCMLE